MPDLDRWNGPPSVASLSPWVARLERPIVGAWWLAAAIAFGTVITEVVPVVSGTGAAARWDWSFLYVSSRFALLPLMSVFNLSLSVAALIQSRRAAETRLRVSALASAVVPISFLLLSYLYPLPWSAYFSS